MTLEHFPRLPDEYFPRIEKLVDSIKGGELSVGEVVGGIMKTAGEKMIPLIMKNAGTEIAEMMPQAMSMLPSMMGKELIVKVKDFGDFKLTIGMLPRPVRVTPVRKDEIDPAMPNIEVVLDVVPLLFRGPEGMLIMVSEEMITINGMDIISEWANGNIMNLMAKSMALTTKDILEPLQEPFISAADEVLSRYGV